jgi:hypothetical protein
MNNFEKIVLEMREDARLRGKAVERRVPSLDISVSLRPDPYQNIRKTKGWWEWIVAYPADAAAADPIFKATIVEGSTRGDVYVEEDDIANDATLKKVLDLLKIVSRTFGISLDMQNSASTYDDIKKKVSAILEATNALSSLANDIIPKNLRANAGKSPEYWLDYHGNLIRHGRVFERIRVPKGVVVVVYTLPGCVAHVMTDETRQPTINSPNVRFSSVRNIILRHDDDDVFAVPYVGGDTAPNLKLTVADSSAGQTYVLGTYKRVSSNSRKFVPYDIGKDTTLAAQIAKHGPGTYYVMACMSASPKNLANEPLLVDNLHRLVDHADKAMSRRKNADKKAFRCEYNSCKNATRNPYEYSPGKMRSTALELFKPMINKYTKKYSPGKMQSTTTVSRPDIVKSIAGISISRKTAVTQIKNQLLDIRKSAKRMFSDAKTRARETPDGLVKPFSSVENPSLKTTNDDDVYVSRPRQFTAFHGIDIIITGCLMKTSENYLLYNPSMYSIESKNLGIKIRTVLPSKPGYPCFEVSLVNGHRLSTKGYLQNLATFLAIVRESYFKAMDSAGFFTKRKSQQQKKLSFTSATPNMPDAVKHVIDIVNSVVDV